jgi:hypothetical protein
MIFSRAEKYLAAIEPKKKYLFFILGAILLIHGNSLRHDFVFDDEHFVQKNAYLQSFHNLGKLLTENIVAGSGLKSNLYRPLQSLTHFIDIQIWGLDPFGHHLTNLLLAMMVGFTLFSLLLKHFSPRTSFWATILFILHPLQSEIVAFISGRGDLLAFIFLFLSMKVFDDEKNWWKVFIFAPLAMMSKESLALIPVYLFLWQCLFRDKARMVLSRYLAISLVSCAYVVSRLTWLNFQNTLNFYNKPNIFTENISCRIFTYFSTIPQSLINWVFPYDLHHERSWSVYVSWNSTLPLLGGVLFFLCLSVSLFWWWKKKNPLYLILFTWWCVASFPTSNLVVLINALFYDHWYVLPGFSLILLYANWLEHTSSYYVQRFAPILAILYSFPTIFYNEVWHNPQSLYEHILKYEPKSAKIHNNLGMYYSDNNENELAKQHYLKAISLTDEFPETHHNLGLLYLRQGEIRHASQEFQLAIKLNPEFLPSLKMLEQLNEGRH